MALESAGDIEGAISAFKVAIQLRPGDPDILYDYGKLLLGQGREEGRQFVVLALRYADSLDLDFERRGEAAEFLN